MQTSFFHDGAGRVGSFLGELAFHTMRQRRRVCERNLGLVFQDQTRTELRKLARASFRHTGAALLESVSIGFLSAETICAKTTFEAWEHFDEAEDYGNGVIIMTAHLGVHEVVSPVVALFRGPMHFVARPFAASFVDQRVQAIRERYGNRTIPKKSAARGMLRVLNKGGRVTILIDQRVHPNLGVEVPFLGQSSWTSPLPAQLSLRCGAPVLPLFVYRRKASRYHVVVHPPIAPEVETTESAVRELTSRYSAAVDKAIRREVPQWLWMHDRWRRH